MKVYIVQSANGFVYGLFRHFEDAISLSQDILLKYEVSRIFTKPLQESYNEEEEDW